MISSGQWTYVLIKMLINSNSHKENQIIQKLTTLILCNLSFLLFQTIQYAQFFCLKSQKAPINSYFQVLCAVIARYTTAVSVINEQRVACDSFALERCCLQLTSTPRDAHPRPEGFLLYRKRKVSYKVKKTAGRVLSSDSPISGLFVNTISPFAVHGLT